ncbi:hypothetical protein F5Y05DRAFT_103996 [Hypoxylon sp. FL0543]|nr:hypothetical protein F5Y05DRAFT_103996 [Hypoxylon sp. FL0543]
MASYDDDDKDKRPEGSRNFPLLFPGPGEMRCASELYNETGMLWNSDPCLEFEEDSQCGEPYEASDYEASDYEASDYEASDYEAPDYQQPVATGDFPAAYGSASPWCEMTYPSFSQPEGATGPPSLEGDSEESISPKMPKVVLPPTQEQLYLAGQSLVGDQDQDHDRRLLSYLLQTQDEDVSSPGLSPQSQRPSLTPSVLHPRPWERHIPTPPGFPSRFRDRPDSCPPGFNAQSQGRGNLRPPPGFTPQALRAAPVTFTPPHVWSQGSPHDPNFALSRQMTTDPRQSAADSPDFAHLYLPMQSRPQHLQKKRMAQQTPQQSAQSSPMRPSVLRQEELRSPMPLINRHERQKKLDEQAKGFDPDDDDAFYPHDD